MKKFLTISLMAVLLLSSCTKENVIERSDDHAIVFENTFVDKATRADITTDNIDEFSVYGYDAMSVGPFWLNERVYKIDEKSSWTYQNLAYWQEESSYSIHAIAPYYNENEVSTWKFTPEEAGSRIVNGNIAFTSDYDTDLVYANHYRSYGYYITGTPEPIQLTFKHLLSRVRIKIVNAMSNSLSRIHILDPAIGPFICDGNIDVSFDESVEPAWTLGNTSDVKTILKQGHRIYLQLENPHPEYAMDEKNRGEEGGVFNGAYISEPVYVIPQTKQRYSTVFSAELGFYHVLACNGYLDLTCMLPEEFTFEPGMSYQFTITITDDTIFNPEYLIKFEDIKVEPWAEWEDNKVNDAYNNIY